MFGLAGRWMIALEINDETSDLVLGELANVKHIEAAGRSPDHHEQPRTRVSPGV